MCDLENYRWQCLASDYQRSDFKPLSSDFGRVWIIERNLSLKNALWQNVNSDLTQWTKWWCKEIVKDQEQFSFWQNVSESSDLIGGGGGGKELCTIIMCIDNTFLNM